MSGPGFFSRERASFACAFRGLADLLRGEPHARFHLAATVAVGALGWWFCLTAGEWIAVILAVGLVWAAEALNTAIEHLADVLHPARHPGIGRVKDIAAAAVLLASIAAALTGMIVFGPRLWLQIPETFRS